MKYITQEELTAVLEKHELWLQNKDGGDKANLNNTDLSGLDLSGANLGGANLSEANLCYANLTRVNLSHGNLHGADLRDANISYAILSDADLGDTNISYAILSDADISYAFLTGVVLYGADLSNANLSSANLHGAYLGGANLSGAYLAGAYLGHADLCNANLDGADLIGADLREADLRGANLGNADLRRTNLHNANLSGADLSGANLRNADLICADLGGATVEDIIDDQVLEEVSNKCFLDKNLITGEIDVTNFKDALSGCDMSLDTVDNLCDSLREKYPEYADEVKKISGGDKFVVYDLQIFDLWEKDVKQCSLDGEWIKFADTKTDFINAVTQWEFLYDINDGNIERIYEGDVFVEREPNQMYEEIIKTDVDKKPNNLADKLANAESRIENQKMDAHNKDKEIER